MLFVSLVVVPASAIDQLTLNVVNGPVLVRPGDVVTVALDVTGLTVPMDAIQAFIHYDTNVLRLVDVLGNDSVGTGWTAITDDRGGGDFLQMLVMLGGDTTSDHTAATLTFEAVGVGTTTVTFLADDPPLYTKLIVAANASPSFPVTMDSQEIVVAAATATFTAIGPTTVSSGTDIVFMVSVDSPSGFDAADIVLGSNDATDIEFVYGAAWTTAFSNVTMLFFDTGLYTQDVFAGGNNATSVGTSLDLGTVTVKTAGMVNGTYQVGIDHTIDGGVSALWLSSVKDLLAGSASFTIGCAVDADCDDGLFCSGTETCVLSTCTPGTAPDCSIASDQCNIGVCNDATGTCDPQPINEGLGCDDGKFCTVTDTCTGGTCIGSGDPCPGESCDETADICFNCIINSDCDDNSICTLDVCNAGTCVNTTTNDGVACSDGESCLVGETCQIGICTGGITPDCSAFDDQCNTATCDNLGLEGNCNTFLPVNEGSACNDGSVCLIGETCQSGACTGGTVSDCTTFDDQCNTASCNGLGIEGNCDTLTPANEGFACNDGDACNVGEACQSGLCTGGTLSDCPGTGDQCVADKTCDLMGIEGNCDTEGVPINERLGCDDDQFCTTGETCTSGVCSGGSVTDCSGVADQCNSGVCNEAQNLCEAQPVTDGTPCIDADPCTENDACSLGTCGGVNVPRITINLEVEGLAPTVTVIRDVTSVMTDCNGPTTETRMVQELFDINGLGTMIVENVDPSATWIQVREAHALSRLTPLMFTACNQATLDLTGLNRLATGDVTGDGFVDIEDLAVLALGWNLAGSRADLNGDGQQNSADRALMLVNLFMTGAPLDGCVP